MNNDKPRRIIVPPRAEKQSKISETSVVPASDLLMYDVKCIMSAELARYRQKTSRGVTLDLKEARIVQGYMDTLIKLQREERESARQQDLSNLSNEELMQLCKSLLPSSPQE